MRGLYSLMSTMLKSPAVQPALRHRRVRTISSDKSSSANDNVVAHFLLQCVAVYACIIALGAIPVYRFLHKKLRFCVVFLQHLVCNQSWNPAECSPYLTVGNIVLLIPLEYHV